MGLVSSISKPISEPVARKLTTFQLSSSGAGLGENFWMEPTSGNVGINATGDNFTLVGSPAHVSAGPSDDVDAVAFSSGNYMYLPSTVTGNPVSTITGSFWIAFSFKISSTGNHTVCGNASATAHDGFYLQLNTSTETIGFVMKGTGAFTNVSVPINLKGSVTGQWHHVIFEYIHQGKDDNTSIILATADGQPSWSTSGGRRDLSISNVTFPIEANNNFTIGEFRETGGSGATFVGDLNVVAGDGELTSEQRWMLWNFGRARNYTSDIENRKPTDNVKWCEGTGITSSQAGYTFRTSTPQTVTIYADSSGQRGSQVDQDANVSPDSYGYVTGTFTGLTAGTKYHIVAENASGIESIHECRVNTIPTTDTKFTIAVLADWSQTSLNAFTSQAFQILAQSETPVARLMNGDEGYWDVETASTSDHVNGIDDEFSGANENADTTATYDNAGQSQFYRWLIYEHLGKAGNVVSDHDGAGNDTDGTATGTAEMVTVNRARHPAWTFLESGKLYFKVDLTPDIGLWCFDNRADSDYSSNDLIGASQLSAFETWLSDIVTAGQIGIMQTERIFSGGEAGTEFWDHGAADRQAVFDAILAEDADADDALFSLAADVHMQAADDGSGQGDFDAGGLARVPSANPGGVNHGSAATKGTWSEYSAAGSQGHYMMLSFTNQTQGSVSVEMKFYQAATVKHTYSFTRTKV